MRTDSDIIGIYEMMKKYMYLQVWLFITFMASTFYTMNISLQTLGRPRRRILRSSCPRPPMAATISLRTPWNQYWVHKILYMQTCWQSSCEKTSSFIEASCQVNIHSNVLLYVYNQIRIIYDRSLNISDQNFSRHCSYSVLRPGRNGRGILTIY